MQVSRTGVIALVTIGVLAGSAYLGLWILLRPPADERCASERFEATLWQDSALAELRHGPRRCMAHDLLRRHQFHGVPRAEVIALLGAPTTTVYFQDYDLVYYIGRERNPISEIDSEWLVFRLDSLQRVAEYRLITD